MLGASQTTRAAPLQPRRDKAHLPPEDTNTAVAATAACCVAAEANTNAATSNAETFASCTAGFCEHFAPGPC